MICARCGTALPPPPYFRNDECPKCAGDLHACVQCAHFDTNLNNQCAESQADRVVDKERANFCDWFKAGEGDGKAATDNPLDAKADALSKLHPL